MSQEERQIESLLLKERWILIAGTERKAIRIRGNKLFVNNKLHGQILNSSFVSSDAEPTKTEMDCSSN